jgi:hypothetical protein
MLGEAVLDAAAAFLLESELAGVTTEAVERLLMRSEGAGHLIERHVGRTAEQLADRLLREPHLKAASTFATLEEAIAATRTAIQANAGEIARWVSSGADGRMIIRAAFRGGSVLARGASDPAVGTGVRIILQGNGGGLWHILTGHPFLL